MHTKRIVPCLDVRDGRVVKGISFVGLKEVDDPVDLARAYYEQGVDELIFLDITAVRERRDTMAQAVERVAGEIFIPFIASSSIHSVKGIRNILLTGTDKVSLNPAVVHNKELIHEGAAMFGNQCVVPTVDEKRCENGNGWNVYVAGGRKDTGLGLLEWVQEGVRLGAGEIPLTSMDAGRTKQGLDIELCKAVHELVDVPVITLGGCGTLERLTQVFEEDTSDAIPVASMFHYKEVTIPEVEVYIKEKGITVRL